jgi:hypothetical protein
MFGRRVAKGSPTRFHVRHRSQTLPTFRLFTADCHGALLVPVPIWADGDPKDGGYRAENIDGPDRLIGGRDVSESSDISAPSMISERLGFATGRVCR